MTNFINTIYTPNDTIVDNLSNYDDVQNWFLDNALANEHYQVNQINKKKYFNELIEYRTTIRDVFMNNIEFNTSLDELVEITNNILLKNKVHPQIVPLNDSFNLRFISNIGKNYNILLVQIAIAVVDLITSRDFKYLKKCSNHKCSLIFIDTSKNHSRRWCSMQTCGNRSKVNSFTKRKKEVNT